MSVSAADGAEPLVSVVVPTYGRNSDLFLEAMQSVFDQTYSNLEVVVVDDSPEPVERLVDDPPVEVRYVRGDHDGVAAARNAGIEAASGAYVAFLDDDDRWLPDKVDRQVSAFREAGADVGVVVTGQRYVDERSHTIGVYEPTVHGDATIDLLLGRINCASSTLMVRKAAIDTTGGLDERFDVWEDLDWCVRLSLSHEFESVSDPLVLRREGDYVQLTDNFEEMRDRAYSLFVRKHGPTAAEYGRGIERQMRASLSLIVGSEGLDNGYYTDARRYLLQSIRLYPFSKVAVLYLLLSLGGRYTYEPANYLKGRLSAMVNKRSA